MNNEQKNTGISNGFLVGIVLGVLLTLLFTTKRGKRILKIITEQGWAKVTEFEELLEEAKDEQYEAPAVSEDERISQEEKEEESSSEEKNEKEKKITAIEKQKMPRRFFKGITRRIVN